MRSSGVELGEIRGAEHEVAVDVLDFLIPGQAVVEERREQHDGRDEEDAHEDPVARADVEEGGREQQVRETGFGTQGDHSFKWRNRGCRVAVGKPRGTKILEHGRLIGVMREDALIEYKQQ